MPLALISAKELKQLLADKNQRVSIIDTRPVEEYQEAHIEGAVHLAWEEWCAKAPAGLNPELDQPGYWGLLSDLSDQEVAARLSKYGFDSHESIVIYADGPRSKGREGRIAWMLLYFGATKVFILNGGYQAWLKAGGACTNSESKSYPAQSNNSLSNITFKVCRDQKRRVLLDELKAMMQENPYPILIDTRTPEEFVGDSYPYMPRTGSLPHAYLIPYAAIFNSDGSFIDKSKFEMLLPAPEFFERKTVAFCEVGVRACTIALLAELYTGKVLPVYDGSMMEWGADPNLPVSRQKQSS